MSQRQDFYVGIKAIIQDPRGVLILKDKSHGKWELPGGRIDQNQTIEDAVTRELQEETGATFHGMQDVIHAGFGDNLVEHNHKLLLTYFAVHASLPKEVKLSDEHSESAWVTKDTLNNFDMYTNEKVALTKYFQEQEKQ